MATSDCFAALGVGGVFVVLGIALRFVVPGQIGNLLVVVGIISGLLGVTCAIKNRGADGS